MLSWPQDFPTNLQFLLRWFHFLAGITWIGMLYFFNLVNVKFQKELDAAIKGKVVVNLMPKVLWWFRWGAVWTWVTGLAYWILILETEAPRHRPLLLFVFGWGFAFLVLAALYRMSVKGGPLKDGRLLAVAIAVVLVAVGWFVAGKSLEWGSSSRSVSILIGGGLGTIMFLNVWMIIWPLQKKIIAAITATVETGAAAPAEQPAWARRAFLASRTNAWMSVPMLFFMGAASHFPIFSVITK
jgi:uncharacterized membrane protein